MNLEIDLRSKRALVTGAGRGIGAAIATALADAGATVGLAGRSEKELDEVASQIPGQGHRIFCSDLSESGAASRLASSAVNQLGGIEILVNNAGEALTRRSEKVTEKAATRMLQVNLHSALELACSVAPTMFEHGGSIINITSMSGVIGTYAQSFYAASKAGLDAATRSLACEWGPRAVRVNSVAPGVIRTDMWASVAPESEFAEVIRLNIALRRWGEPLDIAPLVAFLASDLAAYITGQVIVVDGGLTSTFDPLHH